MAPEKEQPPMAGAWSTREDSESSIDLPHLQHQLGDEGGVAGSKPPSEAAQGSAEADDAWHGNRGRSGSTMAWSTLKDRQGQLMMTTQLA
eukprot:Skav205476  [mRNA]  locus=scaffold830:121958:122227:+ [translate_table: standard]